VSGKGQKVVLWVLAGAAVCLACLVEYQAMVIERQRVEIRWMVQTCVHELNNL
jgi:hypothetical protein